MCFICCYKYVKQKLYNLKIKNMKRKEGYYWVNRQDEWKIGYYDGYGYWKLVGNNYDYTDFDFKKIEESEIKKS